MATTETRVRQRLISADSHVTITDDRFLEHVPGRHLEAAKEVIAQAQARMAASNMPNNRAERNWPAQGRDGDHDQAERLKDQDIDGVEAEVLYSQSTFGFDGSLFYGIADREARMACFRAYNDTLADWIKAAPDRLIPVGVVPVMDVDDGVAELERLAGLGFRALTVPTYPDVHGFEPYWDPKYRPLLQAFAHHGIPLSLHTGATKGLQAIQQADPTPAKGIFQSLPPIHMAELISSWILGGMLPDNPDLHIVLVEAGIGWIAYYLERLDTMFRRHNWPNRGMIKELPSTFWYRQCHATFEDDKVGMRTLDLLGVGNVMWASDYPHPDSTWPESQEVVAKHFEGLPDDDKQRIVWRNAADLYHLG
ncbi:MAG TPA: amidohydrolase family protein [Acidimicrobiales bacterium]|nr:amidohydrolase family protein [Acidimicrobiales bacterium]